MSLARIVLWLGGLGFLGFGVAFLVAPVELIAQAGVAVSGEAAATELRAFYGGLEIALGLLLIGADLRGRRLEGLILSLAAYGGIGSVRLAALLAGSGSNDFMWYALATEAALAGLSALAMRGIRVPARGNLR